MSKKKKDRVKLPKRLLGVKIPKETRRTINAVLKDVPASSLRPMLLAAISALTSSVVARFQGDEGQEEPRKSKPGRVRTPAAGSTLPH